MFYWSRGFRVSCHPLLAHCGWGRRSFYVFSAPQRFDTAKTQTCHRNRNAPWVGLAGAAVHLPVGALTRAELAPSLVAGCGEEHPTCRSRRSLQSHDPLAYLSRSPRIGHVRRGLSTQLTQEL
jgi:hypothetical protein